MMSRKGVELGTITLTTAGRAAGGACCSPPSELSPALRWGVVHAAAPGCTRRAPVE